MSSPDVLWEETIRVFEPKHPRFHCTCTREKVGNMLKMLGRDEIDSALKEMGSLGIDCDFCGLQYRFDAVDVGEMFAPPQSAVPGSQSVQ